MVQYLWLGIYARGTLYPPASTCTWRLALAGQDGGINFNTGTINGSVFVVRGQGGPAAGAGGATDQLKPPLLTIMTL